MADKDKPDDRWRYSLAIWIVVWALAAITILGAFALNAAGSSNAAQITGIKDIISILLPVISAWVGTVLAYYFSRENFVAAAQQTANLVKQLSPDEKLRSVKVRDVMIAIADATKLTLDKPADKVKLQADIIDLMEKGKKGDRLPLLDPQGKIVQVLHRSSVDRFMAEKLKAGAKADDLTLKELLDDGEMKKILTDSFATLSDTATLADAKKLTDEKPNCDDIFITDNGQPGGKVIGWLTDVLIAEHAKA